MKKIVVRIAIKLASLAFLMAFIFVCSVAAVYGATMLFFFLDSKYANEILLGIFVCVYLILCLRCFNANQRAADRFSDSFELY